MKFKCIIDKVSYKSKPQGKDGGAITNRMKLDTMKEYSIDEIKESILSGKTIRPSYCGGKQETWKSQQMFMLDIDNEANLTDDIILNDYIKLVEGKQNKVRFLLGSEQHKSYDDIIEHCKEINLMPNFIYTSFNHKPEQHKMRLVFVLNKEITDYTTAQKIQLFLMRSIGDVDATTCNINRFYYAGKTIPFDSGNILDTDEIIELSKDITPSKVNNTKGSEKCPPNNNYIVSNNIYIIRGTKTQKPDSTRDADDNYNIKAIRNRDVEYLKKKLNHPHMLFNNNKEFCDYIFKEINLGELLEFKYPTSIKCIFHDDHNPSAGIKKQPDGTWMYNCFGCGVSLNLLGVIEVLGKFRSRPKAYKFIRDIFNLEMSETEWQKEQKAIIDENLRALDTGEFEKRCPQAYKNIKSNLKFLRKLLYIAKDNVTTEKMTDDEDNVLFFASNKFLANELEMKESSSKEISKKSVLMAYHKLLNKIDNSKVPKDLLKRSQAISINSTDKNKKYRHVNYYSIPSYNNMLFPGIERQGRQWKDNNYTIKGLSREMFFRKEGQEVANWLYPQYKQVFDKQKETIIDRTTTFRSDKRTEKIVEIIMWYIENINHCLEKDIICNLVFDEDIRIKKSEAERQLKKSLPEILDAYGLKRIRANKEIKEKLGVVSDGYPSIIVKNDNLHI